MGNRRRNLFVLIFVDGLFPRVAEVVIATQPTKLGLDLERRHRADLPGQGRRRQNPQIEGGRHRSLDRDHPGARPTASASQSPRSRAWAPTPFRVGPAERSRTPSGPSPPGRRPQAQLYFYDWEPNVIPNPARAPGAGADRDSRSTAALRRGQVGLQADPRVFRGHLHHHRAELLPLQRPDGRELISQAPRVHAQRPVQPTSRRTRSPSEGRAGDRHGARRERCVVQEGGARRRPPPHADIDEKRREPQRLLRAQGPAGIERVGDQATRSSFDPTTNQPNVTFDFSGDGQQAFQDVTKKIAERGAHGAAHWSP